LMKAKIREELLLPTTPHHSSGTPNPFSDQVCYL
jgi:hypothetical protein